MGAVFGDLPHGAIRYDEINNGNDVAGYRPMGFVVDGDVEGIGVGGGAIYPADDEEGFNQPNDDKGDKQEVKQTDLFVKGIFGGKVVKLGVGELGKDAVEMGKFVVIKGENTHQTEKIGDGESFYPAGKVGLVVIGVSFVFCHG